MNCRYSSLVDDPEPLGDGLVMRRATVDDVEALFAFNAEIYREPGQSEPNEWIATWTRDLMTRPHPTFAIHDFLIVEDTRTRRIVSSLYQISQTWSYGGMEFGLACPSSWAPTRPTVAVVSIRRHSK